MDSSNGAVSLQSLRLLINLSTNEHMIQYLYSANVSIQIAAIIALLEILWNYDTFAIPRIWARKFKLIFDFDKYER